MKIKDLNQLYRGILPAVALLLSLNLFAAEKTSLYTGVATKEGKTIYIEKHEVAENEKGDVLRAKTTYSTPEDKVIATLTSDFAQSITNAEHEMHDLRTERRYGVRWKNGQAYMWDKKTDKKEEREEIGKDFADGKLVIGGQGLHYYMRSRLKEFAKKEVAIAILIPGKLDWYSFLVVPAGEEKGLLKFVMKTQSAILRLFAPKLEVWYSPEGKLMRYRGLSNLSDDKGNNQNVEITYTY
jgi:hypothetical protein